MRHRLTLDQIDAARATRGRAALLYVTDRCPVGCAHCSVDALPHGRRITDWARFARVLHILCTEPGLAVVGVSGGEPFGERRGLVMAARRLTAAGRQLVPYTSGNWAARPVRGWVREVLRMSSCVVLSTDGYHAARLPDSAFVGAARAIAAEGTWIGCQAVSGARVPGREPPAREVRADQHAEAALALLRKAFGPGWESYAELRTVPLLRYGRASGPSAAPPLPAAAAGRCTVAATPVVRYDGAVAACCNERVASGGGPPGLRRSVDDPEVLGSLAADPYLTALGSLGAAPLTALPAYRDLADAEVADLCDLCWRMVARGTEGPAVRALAALAPSGTLPGGAEPCHGDMAAATPGGTAHPGAPRQDEPPGALPTAAHRTGRAGPGPTPGPGAAPDTAVDPDVPEAVALRAGKVRPGATPGRTTDPDLAGGSCPGPGGDAARTREQADTLAPRTRPPGAGTTDVAAPRGPGPCGSGANSPTARGAW